MPWYRVKNNVFLNGEYVEAGDVGFSPNTIADPSYTPVSGPDPAAPPFLIPPFSDENLITQSYVSVGFDGTYLTMTRFDGSITTVGPFTAGGGGGGGPVPGALIDSSGATETDSSGATITS